MKKILSTLFALVLAVSLMFVACVTTPPPYQEWDPDIHGQVTFMQLFWMASPEEALYPHSNVGAVEFAFLEETGDWLLDSYGGGYLNVVIDTTAAGGAEQWAVQNLYLTYKNLDYLLGSTPTVQFSLGLDGKTPINSLEAAVFLSSKPLEEQPEAEKFFTYRVSLMPYLVGGLDGGGSAISTIPFIIGPWVGPISLPKYTAWSLLYVSNVSAIDEGHMGCAPASAARSISYLGELHGFDTDDPQDIYDDLVESMDTDICGNGTFVENMLAGKNSYCDAKGLPINSEIVSFDPQQVRDALDNGCAVEILIGWSGGGGHAAMVTGVTVHTDGSTTITYVDDPNQGDGVAENQEHVITTDASGEFANGTVFGFMIEKKG